MNADDSHSDHPMMITIVCACSRCNCVRSNRHASGPLLDRGFLVL